MNELEQMKEIREDARQMLVEARQMHDSALILIGFLLM